MMDINNEKDIITIKDDAGNVQEVTVEGIFEMKGNTYTLLSSKDGEFIMQVEQQGDDQYLVGVKDPKERSAIIDAYYLAINADEQDHQQW